MALKLEVPMATARILLNDANKVRYSDADLLLYANDALDEMMLLVPQLFYADGDMLCTEDKSLQVVSCQDAHALVTIRRIKYGKTISGTTKEVLDAFDPSWMTKPSATALHWMPSADDPRRFYLYPPAPLNQILEVCYVRIPPEFKATDETMIEPVFSDAIADYIVYRAEARDDEHVNSNRAAQFMASFVQKVKGPQ